MLQFAERFAELLTEADDLGVTWTTDNRTYVAVKYPDETGERWIEDITIGWNGRHEVWRVLQ